MLLGEPLLLKLEEGLTDPTAVFLSRASHLASAANAYNESFLQDLIDNNPALLPVSNFYPGSQRLFSLGREIPLSLGDSLGYVDNLLVTDDGHLVLVETKLYRNPQAVREVIAQALHYCMALSALTPSQFEAQLRLAAPGPNRLSASQTLATYIGDQGQGVNTFEQNFDRLRENGEILLLLVGDGVRLSASRLVEWMNSNVGSSPYHFGLIELRFYDLPSVGRIVIPQTLLQTREASRHVVVIEAKDRLRELVDVSVKDGHGLTTQAPSNDTLLTEDDFFALVDSKNSPAISADVHLLVSNLKQSMLASRSTRHTLQFGIEITPGDFVPFINLSSRNIWVQIPKRGYEALGAKRFIAAKQLLSDKGNFYRSEDVENPSAKDALAPSYDVLAGKVEVISKALAYVAEDMQSALRFQERMIPADGFEVIGHTDDFK